MTLLRKFLSNRARVHSKKPLNSGILYQAAMTGANVSADKTDASAKHVFWASYFGWLLDGYDTTIYAFVLLAALGFILPNSGISKKLTAEYGLSFFAIFLVGWGTAFIFGPLADRVGRMRTLGIAILLYALGTFFSGLSYNVLEFGIARFIAGLGLGAEWFIGGTGVAEVFPESRRKIWAGRFHSAWYAGFILAAVTTPLLLQYVFRVAYAWRIIFFIGIVPALILAYIRLRTTEPEVWQKKKDRFGERMNMRLSFKVMFSRPYIRNTVLLVLVMIPVITGLYGAVLYTPSTITGLVHDAFTPTTSATWYVVLGGTTISGLTLLFCLLMPYMATRFGRKTTLAIFMTFMIVGLITAFGIADTQKNLYLFLPLLVLLGIGGADFSVFSLWVPELYPTEARAGGFAVITTLGRYAGAGIVFVIAALSVIVGLGEAIAYGSIAFIIGIIMLVFVKEDRTRALDRTTDKMAVEVTTEAN